MINSFVKKCVCCVSHEISNDWHVLVVFTLTSPLLCMDSNRVTATTGFNFLFLFVYFLLLLRPGGPRIFLKNDLRIWGARKSTRSKFLTKDRQVLGATGHHEVVRATSRPKFVCPWFRSAYRVNFMLIKCDMNKVGGTEDVQRHVIWSQSTKLLVFAEGSVPCLCWRISSPPNGCGLGTCKLASLMDLAFTPCSPWKGPHVLHFTFMA